MPLGLDSHNIPEKSLCTEHYFPAIPLPQPACPASALALGRPFHFNSLKRQKMIQKKVECVICYVRKINLLSYGSEPVQGWGRTA